MSSFKLVSHYIIIIFSYSVEVCNANCSSVYTIFDFFIHSSFFIISFLFSTCTLYTYVFVSYFYPKLLIRFNVKLNRCSRWCKTIDTTINFNSFEGNEKIEWMKKKKHTHTIMVFLIFAWAIVLWSVSYSVWFVALFVSSAVDSRKFKVISRPSKD